MDNHTPKERARHILECIRLIKTFVDGMSLAAFEKDIVIQSAVQYQFLVIGEAVRYIDDTILAKYPYQWHIPRAFRNFIIHVYHGVKMERIYFAANDLDELERQVQLILDNEFD
jgi:uncharacterized protein with HEPN domain